jgi:phosphoribosylformimino-5-aminoimidazole carboxamide ribotide isomerase
VKVIPAIDLLDGKVVRLHKGSYDEVTEYNDSPLNQARTFKEAGFNHIHVVDLNGARKGEFENLPHVQSIVDELDISVQMGGGIRSYESARNLLEAGISKIVCSSMAVKNAEDWQKTLENYPGRSILGLDLKGGKLAYSGWEKTSDAPVRDFLQQQVDHGLQEVLCTDISRDGTLEGVNRQLYQRLMQQFPGLNFIASGGVSGADDLKNLSEDNLHAVVVGRAYYENKLTLSEMKAYHNS